MGITRSYIKYDDTVNLLARRLNICPRLSVIPRFKAFFVVFINYNDIFNHRIGGLPGT